MQRKTWYSIFGVDAMPLSLKNPLLKEGDQLKRKWQKIILTKIDISLTEQFHFQNATFQFLKVGADDAASRAKLCRFVFYAPNKAR